MNPEGDSFRREFIKFSDFHRIRSVLISHLGNGRERKCDKMPRGWFSEAFQEDATNSGVQGKKADFKSHGEGTRKKINPFLILTQ